MSPFEMLMVSAARTPHAPAVEWAGGYVDYQALGRMVADLAGRLRARGIGPGDRVALMVGRDVTEVALLLAVSACRASFTVMNRLWKAPQVDHAIRTLRPRLFVADAAAADRLARPDILGLNQLLDTAPLPLDVGQAQDTDVAAILFTSGSTGLPKGVVHDVAALAAWTRSTNAYLENRPGDRVLAFLPLAFGYGLNQLLTMLAIGGCYRISRSTMVPDIARELAEAPVTGLAGVPAFWRDFARVAPAMGLADRHLSLRGIANAGGHCPPEIMRRVRDIIGGRDVVLMYGMTETLRSTFLPPRMFDAKAGALGVAVPGARVSLVNENGKACAPGEVGEIVHVGATVARGYFGRPDADAQRFRPPPGWMACAPGTAACWTGDLAHSDEDGILWYHARGDRQIKVKGFRVSPTEIEDAARRVDGVEDAVALSLPAGDGEAAIHLAVAGRPDERALATGLRQSIASYMVPARIHVWPSAFPLTPNGKTDVEAIKAAITRETAPATSPADPA